MEFAGVDNDEGDGVGRSPDHLGVDGSTEGATATPPFRLSSVRARIPNSQSPFVTAASPSQQQNFIINSSSVTCNNNNTAGTNNNNINNVPTGRKKGWGEVFRKVLFCSCCSCCPFLRTSRNKDKDFRTVIPNHKFDDDLPHKLHPNRKYAGNTIRTTKYTILSFLPKNLFEQFHRFANLYFIFVVVLNWIPQIEAFGKELSMIPVMFVMSVTAFKDAFEDFRRYKSDQKINSTTCRVWHNVEKRYVKTMWKDVIVGDFVHLSCNEKIPADILLLRSSDASGTCYVETSNLDGESNLKQRQVVTSSQEMQENRKKTGSARSRRMSVTETFKPTDFTSHIQCEPANSAIYKFNAFILHGDGAREPANKNNLLLRGCELRNTDFIEGIVIYAGRETKSMMNNSGPRYKRSDLERLMNWDIVWCVVILLVMCVVGAIGSGIWLNSFEDAYDVIFLTFTKDERNLKPELEAFINFWSYIIILQVMIPISLYVSIEIIKLGQIFFIVQDVDLYDAETNKKMQCRALNIPEELGQIQYVLSDKTGTLTENKMIFRRCAVAGIDYGPSEATEQKDLPSASPNSECVEDVAANPRLVDLLRNLSWDDVYAHNSPENPSPTNSSRDTSKDVFEFFLTLTVCNTVVVTSHPHVDVMNASGYFVGDAFVSDGASFGPSRAETPRNGTPTPGSTATTPMSTPGLTPTYNGAGRSRPLPTLDEGGITAVDMPSPNFYLSRTTDSDADDLGTTQETTFTTASIVTGGSESAETGLTNLSVTTEGGLTPIPEIRTELELRRMSEPSPLHQLPRPNTLSGLGNMKSLLGLPNPLKRLKALSTPRLGEKSGASTPAPLNPIYEAESPDELSLVYAAKAYGFRLVKRHLNTTLVEMPNGHIERFQILHTLGFDAVRKRMSVIVRSQHSPNPILLCKGADSIIMDLLAESYIQSQRGQTTIFKSQEYLNLYASYGLRTLCLAKRELSEEEYNEWAAIHQEAETALEDREQLLFESAVEIEKELELLGVTGIEDQLQEGVPECIASLRHAGMKVWVLTGDKIETAVSIAYASRLFSYGMNLIQLCAKNESDIKEAIERELELLDQRQGPPTASHDGSRSHPLLGDGRPKKRDKIGVVVDGRTLAFCLRSRGGSGASGAPGPHATAEALAEWELRKDIEDKFIQLISRCTSVLCCRATPSQKAHIVKLVKNHMQGKTLAIGDGANDVAMIQSADVGIGISGQEGMQAVMAADFAIGRFRFLKRLLLVHGHWCYDRLARTVLYFFYKNALFVFTLFWFQLFCGFSSQVIIDPVYLMLYNLIFTSLPPLLLGVFDQDVSDHLLLDQPRLYAVGRTGSLYKSYSFWLNMLDALWQSLVVYFVTHLVYSDTDIGLWSFGFLIFSALVVCNQMHLAIEVKAWTMPLVASIILSILIYYAFALVYNALVGPAVPVDNPPFWVAENMVTTATYWLALFFITILALLPRMTVKIVRNSLAPPQVLLARLKFKMKQSGPGGTSLKAIFCRSARNVTIVPADIPQMDQDGNSRTETTEEPRTSQLC